MSPLKRRLSTVSSDAICFKRALPKVSSQQETFDRPRTRVPYRLARSSGKFGHRSSKAESRVPSWSKSRVDCRKGPFDSPHPRPSMLQAHPRPTGPARGPWGGSAVVRVRPTWSNRSQRQLTHRTSTGDFRKSPVESLLLPMPQSDCQTVDGADSRLLMVDSRESTSNSRLSEVSFHQRTLVRHLLKGLFREETGNCLLSPVSSRWSTLGSLLSKGDSCPRRRQTFFPGICS